MNQDLKESGTRALGELQHSYGNGRFDDRVGLVTDEFEVFVVKLVDVLDGGVQFQKYTDPSYLL